MRKLKRRKRQRTQITFPDLPIGAEVRIAMAEYKARKDAREQLARNEECIKVIDRADDHREMWMFGIFALALHRRYRYTSKTIEAIFSQVQELHNELYDMGLTDPELEKKVCEMVADEIGLQLVDDDNEEVEQ